MNEAHAKLLFPNLAYVLIMSVVGVAGCVFFWSDPYDWFQITAGAFLLLAPLAIAGVLMWRWGWVLSPKKRQIWARGKRWDATRVIEVVCQPPPDTSGYENTWRVRVVFPDGTIEQRYGRQEAAERVAAKVSQWTATLPAV